MFTFNILQYVPKFILDDKNGYAISKALEAAVQYMNDTVDAGVKVITDSESMPEWRLDELAWEYNILYDYSKDIETKRNWIKDAIQTHSIYGTPEIVSRYLGAAFKTVDLEECWEYGGDPYHFRVTVTGDWTEENDEWTKKAIEKTKNVRSVLDSITFSAGNSNALLAAGVSIAGVEINVTSQTMEEEELA